MWGLNLNASYLITEFSSQMSLHTGGDAELILLGIALMEGVRSERRTQKNRVVGL